MDALYNRAFRWTSYSLMHDYPCTRTASACIKRRGQKIRREALWLLLAPHAANWTPLQAHSANDEVSASSHPSDVWSCSWTVTETNGQTLPWGAPPLSTRISRQHAARMRARRDGYTNTHLHIKAGQPRIRRVRSGRQSGIP